MLWSFLGRHKSQYLFPPVEPRYKHPIRSCHPATPEHPYMCVNHQSNDQKSVYSLEDILLQKTASIQSAVEPDILAKLQVIPVQAKMKYEETEKTGKKRWKKGRCEEKQKNDFEE